MPLRNLNIAEIRVVSNIVSWPNDWHLILKDVFLVTEESFCNLQPQKEDRLWKVYTFIRLGRMVTAFLPVQCHGFLSLIGSLPSSMLHLKKYNKNKPTWMKQGIFQNSRFTQIDYSCCWWTKNNIIRESHVCQIWGATKSIEVHHLACFEFQPTHPHLFGMRRPPNSRWRPGVEGTAQTYHPAWCERYQGKGGQKRFEASFASHSVSWCSTTKLFYLHSTVSFGSKFQYIWSRIKSWLFRKG